jgi:hypothetical protein
VKCDGKALADEALVAASVDLLRLHLNHRPAANPVTNWRIALPRHFEWLAARDSDFFHLYAFNLPRQLGANFEMLGTYLQWLGTQGEDGLAEAALASRRLAEAAKTVQFQLARMAHRRKFDAATLNLAPIEADYALIMSTLAARFP